jgi:hypothetical protein
MKGELSLQIFEKYSHIQFHENPPSEFRVVACRRTDRRTDMTKLIVAFRSFANAPINVWEESAEELRDLKLKDTSQTG